MEATSRLSPVANTAVQTHRTPLKLIRTADLQREEWLTVRRGGIGSSDAAAAVGLNPYCSALELWLDKTGRGTPKKPDPEDDSSPTYWGSLLEPIVAAHYTRRTGLKVRRVKAVLQHPQCPWMLANIDREVMSSSEVQILECKTAGIHGSRLWESGVPEYVQIQVMHQLAVTGKQAADVAVLLGGQELRVHRIQRDEAVIAHLIALEKQFWWHVENDVAPSADGSASADQALRLLFPNDSGTTVDWSEDVAMNQVFDDLLHVRQSMVQDEAELNRLKQQIAQAMGDAGTACFANGRISYRTSKDSQTLDLQRLKEEQAELLRDYQITQPGSRRFLVKPAVNANSTRSQSAVSG